MPQDIEVYEVQVGYWINGGNFHIMTVGIFTNAEEAKQLVDWIQETYPGQFSIYFETERANNMDLFKETVGELVTFIKENES